jgi:hypothetical protein
MTYFKHPSWIERLHQRFFSAMPKSMGIHLTPTGLAMANQLLQGQFNTVQIGDAGYLLH